METITLYHGSVNKIEKMNDNRWGIYFSPSIETANDYIFSQADNKAGEYGFIYKVEINESDIMVTEDIDQLEKSDNVLFCIEDGYYRIDKPSRYNIVEMSSDEISNLLK